MKDNNIVVGLDIGTSATKVLVAAKREGASLRTGSLLSEEGLLDNFEVLSFVQEASLGVRKGVVFNINNVSEICRIALRKAEEESGRKIDSVYVNINGTHIFSSFSHGLVSVSRADRKIPQEDVDRVLQVAQTSSMTPSNFEIIEMVPKEFSVDGQNGLKEVVGMEGVRLEVDVMSVGVFSPYLNNLTKAVLDAGVQINDIMPSVMASGLSVLKSKEKEGGVAVVEIGAGTTGIAVYKEGELMRASVLPMGSSHITNDIAAGLKVDPDLAEKIKLEFGNCLHRGADKKEKIEIDEGEFLSFSHKQLTAIITSRVSEIFGEVNKELKKLQKETELPSGVVLTGGGAKLPGMLDLARKELKTYCRIGRPLGFSFNEDDVSLATVCGLALNGFGLEDNGETTAGFELPFTKGMGSRLKRIFRSFMP